MSILLVDTDVVSFVFKGDSRANEYAQILQGNRLAVSFMTVAELFQWAALRNWGVHKIDRLEQTLSTYLVIPPDLELCRTWGNLRSQMQSIGRAISPQDAWIAATALRHNLPLVTHNAKDFQSIQGLKVRTIQM